MFVFVVVVASGVVIVVMDLKKCDCGHCSSCSQFWDYLFIMLQHPLPVPFVDWFLAGPLRLLFPEKEHWPGGAQSMNAQKQKETIEMVQATQGPSLSEGLGLCAGARISHAGSGGHGWHACPRLKGVTLRLFLGSWCPLRHVRSAGRGQTPESQLDGAGRAPFLQLAGGVKAPR